MSKITDFIEEISRKLENEKGLIPEMNVPLLYSEKDSNAVVDALREKGFDAGDVYEEEHDSAEGNGKKVKVKYTTVKL